MIKDHITHAKRYLSVHPLFSDAFQWLTEYANRELPDGRIELNGNTLIALPQHYETRAFDATKFETHHRYIDIQYIVSGSERIAVGDPTAMTLITPYDSVKDIAFFRGAGSTLTVNAGECVVLWPHEAHVPCCHPAKTPVPVHKIVLKVAISPQTN